MKSLQHPVATVIIPEHKRPEHLRRLLDYFTGSGINIIVADSSDDAFCYLDEFKDQIVYRHYPATPLAEKLYHVLPLIETPYVFMCANDDFIVPASVFRIIHFLESHPAYNSGQGIFTDFTVTGDQINTSLRYVNTTDIDLANDRPVERLFELQRNYFQYYYCVFRTAMFRKVITSVLSDNRAMIRNLCLLESYMSLYTAMEGKHIIMPIFYAARENIFNSAAANTDAIPSIASKKKYRDEYNSYLRLLTAQLARLENIPENEAAKLVGESMKIYITRLHPDYFTAKGRIKQQLKNFIQQIDVIGLKSAYSRLRYIPSPYFSPLELQNGEHWKDIEQSILKYRSIYNKVK
jgi:glycosyltransferase domain-containing protein